MLGAIIGDMVGSLYDSHPIKRKDFKLFNPEMRMTDDSYLTIALAKALMKHYPIKYDEDSIKSLQKDLAEEFVNTFFAHPSTGFGEMFFHWCLECRKTGQIAPAYCSYGNGSAMRISPVGWMANSEEEVKLLSKIVTEITHNHPEGLKGAEAVAMCIYLARNGYTKEQIKERMVKEYYPEIADLDFDELVRTYHFNASCQESVPQAIYCFLISTSLVDSIRNAVAIGGDSDTQACMAGAIAEAYYQRDQLSKFEDRFIYLMLDNKVEKLLKDFHKLIHSDKMNHRVKE